MNQILVLDDDEVTRVYLESILTANGFYAILSENSSELFQKLESGNVAMILLDYYLEKEEGLEILKKLKSIVTFSAIPVIMLTGEDDPAIFEKCFDEGAVDFINKPIVSKVLLSRIKTVIANQDYIRQIKSQKKILLESEEKIRALYTSLQKQLEEAKSTQETLIPSIFENLDFLKLYSYYKPIDQVGGDFFCYKVSDNATIDILFGDVSGHGISSALIACMTILFFKTAISEKSSVSETLQKIHETLKEYVKNHYITATLLRYHSNKKLLEYSYAGHQEALLFSKDKVSLLEGKGNPLLLFPDIVTKKFEINISSKDRLLLYSDGLYEFFLKDGDFFGHEQFFEISKNHTRLSSDALLESLALKTEELSDGKHLDDKTMLMLEFL